MNYNIILWPETNNIYINAVSFLFGNGFGNDKLHLRSYDFLGLELRLITIIYFKFGIIHIILLFYLMFHYNQKQTNVFNPFIYKYIIFTFIISSTHYSLIYTVGINELFWTILSLKNYYTLRSKISKRSGRYLH